MFSVSVQSRSSLPLDRRLEGDVQLIVTHVRETGEVVAEEVIVCAEEQLVDGGVVTGLLPSDDSPNVMCEETSSHAGSGESVVGQPDLHGDPNQSSQQTDAPPPVNWGDFVHWGDFGPGLFLSCNSMFLTYCMLLLTIFGCFRLCAS